MAQPIVMPKLGQTVEEASIVKWHKQVGDAVKKGDVLFEIETDKAVLEAESFFDGTLIKVLVPIDKMVPVSSVVAYIGEKGEAVPDAPPAAVAAPAAPPAEPVKEAPKPDAAKAPPEPPAAPPPPRQVSAAQVVVPSLPHVSSPSPQPSEKRLFISPRAKAVAKAKCISVANVTGTGPNGRIVVKDIEAYLDARNYDALRITPAAKRLAAKEDIDILTVRPSGTGGRISIHDVERSMAARPRKMSKMRQTIARRLTESFMTTPHFYVTTSVDMTDLLTYRQELKAQGQAYKVTDFILSSVVMSLEELPIVNSITDGATVTWYESVHLGLAVGLDDGLVVPPIRNAQELSLAELSAAAADLGKRAREGKLMPDEMTGSTFTVSNMGMLNVENFCAIINPGEGGILAVASTIPTPVVRDGQVVVRQMMKMTLSVDHRIIDGTVGAQFINAVKDKLEDVKLWKHLT